MTKVGFTGTQVGMSGDQAASVSTLLLTFKSGERDEFHHGGCVGSDVQAAELARLHGYLTVRHPGNMPSKQDKRFVDDEVYMVLPNMARNHMIVDQVEMMIAAPKQSNEVLRSGTWSTIRYSRRVSKRIYIVQPDGLIV